MIKKLLLMLNSGVIILIPAFAQAVSAQSADAGSVQKGQSQESAMHEDKNIKTMEQRHAEYMAAFNAMPDTEGTGPYPALMEVDPGLPDHVVYRPVDLLTNRRSLVF